MRFEVARLFEDWFLQNKNSIKTIAVVGGSSLDAEMLVVQKLAPDIRVVYVGIDNSHNDKNFINFDLNNEMLEDFDKFDLVLCSQVLEHVWNMSNAFDALTKMVRRGGYLWISCPASNMVHGSPEYFSAGYAPEYLTNNLEIRNFEILSAFAIGSKRYYFMTHVLRFWATKEEHESPLLKYKFQPGTFLGISRKFILDIPGRLMSSLNSKKITNELTYATESVVLGKLKA
jgi:SAM-dependent methyltransferase